MFILFVQFQYLSTSWWQSVAETTIGLDFRFLPVMAVWLRFMTWYIICHNFVQGANDPDLLNEDPAITERKAKEREAYHERICRVIIHLLSLWPVVFVPAVSCDMDMTLFLLLVVMWIWSVTLNNHWISYGWPILQVNQRLQDMPHVCVCVHALLF